MNLTDDAAARRVDPATVATWTVLARARGEAAEYHVCTADGSTYYVVERPDGPENVILAVSKHDDYVSALRLVVAWIEDEEPAGRHAATPVDITSRLRIRRTWYCDAGEYSGMFGVGLEPLYVTRDELEAFKLALKEDN